MRLPFVELDIVAIAFFKRERNFHQKLPSLKKRQIKLISSVVQQYIPPREKKKALHTKKTKTNGQRLDVPPGVSTGSTPHDDTWRQGPITITKRRRSTVFAAAASAAAAVAPPVATNNGRGPQPHSRVRHRRTARAAPAKSCCVCRRAHRLRKARSHALLAVVADCDEACATAHVLGSSRLSR